jgi:hypothetical protein
MAGFSFTSNSVAAVKVNSNAGPQLLGAYLSIHARLTAPRIRTSKNRENPALKAKQ